MVPLVPCRSITTYASRLNYIHSCPSDMQRHCAWISAVMFHSSLVSPTSSRQRLRLVLCLPSSGNLASPSHSRFSDSVSKHYTSIFSERELKFKFAIGYRPSVCLSVVCLSVTFVHLLRRLKFSAIFLRHVVPWPSMTFV